jgi:hypothetical protein
MSWDNDEAKFALFDQAGKTVGTAETVASRVTLVLSV